MIQERIEDNIVVAEFASGKFNSLTLEMLYQIRDIVKKVNDEDELKGLIFTGSGKIFCSGFDLPTFLGFKDLAEAVEFFKVSEDVFIDVFMCKKPVIAAMNGSAMAGGLILGNACDYRLIKNHPKIQVSMSEVKIGLGLSVVQTALMRYGLDSEKGYRDVMYFGERYNVDGAKEVGLVDEIVEGDQLLPRAKEIITTWIDNPGRSFMLLKYSQRRPYEEEMRKYLKTENWQDGLNCIFHPDTRATLEIVNKMMEG